MRRDLVKLVGGILFGGAMLVALAACASSTGAASSAPEATTPAAGAAPTTQQSTQPADKPASDPLAQGKLLFEKTAGGVGCAACHGLDGKGSPTPVNAPNIRGKNEGDVRAAISGGVPMMTEIIKLNDEQIAAVVAYLDYLSRQP